MVALRPLFGARASVDNVKDHFGDTVELVKSSESEQADPVDKQQFSVDPTSSEMPLTSQTSSVTAQQGRHHQQQQQPPPQQGGQSITSLLNGAALTSPQDDHSHPQDDDSDDAQPHAEPAVIAIPPSSRDNAAAWQRSANEAESSDQHQSSRVRSKLSRALKKVDAKVRTTLGVNAPPTADEMRSPYSIGVNDHVSSRTDFGAAELLNDASLETLQSLHDADEAHDADEDDDDVGDLHDEDDEDDRTVHGGNEPVKPDLARMERDLEELRRAKSDAHDHSSSMTGVTPGDSVATDDPVHLSAEEKMKALIDEFGECPSISQPNEPEKLLIDIAGVLVKTILIKGNIFLTNRRVCFLAYIPNAKHQGHDVNADASIHDDDHEDPSTIRAPSDPNVRDPVLKSGPAIIHRPGKMRPKRRVWIELRRDSINAYASSNQLYKPLLSARLSNLYAVLPIDWSQPNIIRFVEESRYSSLEFKTQEAALDWRKELEAAAFHARNTAEKVRISIPLERIVSMDSATVLNVAKIVHLDILVGSVKDAEAAQAVQEHRERTERHQLVDQSWSTGHVFVSCPKNPGFKCHITQLALGVTNKRAAFIDLLREAMKVPKSTHDPLGFQELLRAVPPPMLELDGEADVEHSSGDGKDSNDLHNETLAEKFCHSFGLPSRPEELKLVKAELVRTLHTHGTMAIGLDYLLFWRRAVGRELKIKVPLTDLRGVNTYRSLLWHHHGLAVHIQAHPDMLFEFLDKDARDMVLSTLQRIVQAKEQQQTSSSNVVSENNHANKKASASLTKQAKANEPPEKSPTKALLHNAESDVPVFEPEALAYFPKVVNVDPNTYRDSIRISPMRIYCLTIGSRGDVQPYIALCKALKEHGHTPVIVSHPEYRDWVEGHGIQYRGVGGDPAALMKLSVEHRIFSPAFFRESIGKFRVWLDELLRECWEQCQGADLLIESPSTMAGIHVAEGLGIPYFRAFTMPWTKTSAYPQAFSVPSIEMGPSYNSSSYVLFDQIMWVATSGQINRWRKHMVGIEPTDLSKLDSDSVPFIYNFSPAVVPMPNDWGDRIKISGYWFLDNPESNWSPPKEMVEFLERAKKDRKKIAYIGFGSITIENAEEVSANIMKAVHQADLRAIVAKGWSGRGGSKPKKSKKQPKQRETSAHNDSEDTGTEEEHEPEAEIPQDVFVVDSVPHDWLFPQIDIAMHHGGAGTTGASLRAGLVTLIKPFFGDQFFWANRVHKLGAGAKVNGLSVSDLSDALKSAASDRVMVEKAQGVGERIRSEDGVATAIEFLYKNIPLAKRRTQRRLEREATHASAGTSSGSVFTHSLALFGRQHSGRSDSSNSTHRSATLPLSPSSLSPSSEDAAHDVRRWASTTVVGSPSAETDEPEPMSPRSEKGKSSGSILPSLSALNSLPASMASTLKEMITLQSSTSDTTADGEESHQAGPGRSVTTPEQVETGDETEEQKMQRLKGYKNAKAEDIRRRKLLQERLERERRQEAEKQEKEREQQQQQEHGQQEKESDSNPQRPTQEL